MIQRGFTDNRSAPRRVLFEGFSGAAIAKQKAAERWAARRLGGVDHERRVMEIATRLFHLTRPLHDLGRADLQLLRLAAAVHDVGRSVRDATHAEDGARLLLVDTALGVAPTERRQLAYLTRYHRGDVAVPGKDEILRRCDEAPQLLQILALLRAADALDSRSLESPRLVLAFVRAATPRLCITCYLDVDSPKARRIYSRRKKFRLLEASMQCRVELEVSHAEELALVA